MKFQKGKSGFEGRLHTSATKEKIRKTRKGKKLLEETKRKLREANKGKVPWNKGKHPEYLQGKNHWKWNGGKHILNGYKYLFKPNHPLATETGYAKRSRLVMEKKLGRPLQPEEVVHHINGILDDDREENLMLFENNSKHIKYHWLMRKGSDFLLEMPRFSKKCLDLRSRNNWKALSPSWDGYRKDISPSC